MFWILRFCAAGTAVTLSSLISRRLGPTAGGMVLAFPFVIGTGMVLTVGEGRGHLRELATGVLLGLGPLLLFVLTVVLLAPRLHPVMALVAGVGGWLVSAGVVQWLK